MPAFENNIQNINISTEGTSWGLHQNKQPKEEDGDKESRKENHCYDKNIDQPKQKHVIKLSFPMSAGMLLARQQQQQEVVHRAPSM